MRIGITGINGFLGWHLRVHLHARPGIVVVGADRSIFGNEDALSNFVTKCDAIVHFAGMNRGEDAEIQNTNLSLTEQLIQACERKKAAPHVVFASSVHIYRDTVYGRSKRECTDRLSAWAAQSGARFTTLVLPHVFGECGRPFYNSAVATFCYQIANDQHPEVINDGELELVHAQDVAAKVLEIIQEQKIGVVMLAGKKISVSAVLAQIKELAAEYKERVPKVDDAFCLRLFNSYRSYLYPKKFPISLTLHKDDRGVLFEAVKSQNAGQSFMSDTKPGITRGNHFHFEKVERFLVLKGEAIIRVRKMFSDTVYEYKVSGAVPQYVDMPTLHTHNISNIGQSELTTFFWSHQIFDPAAPDTVAEAV
jgi:UDP-2-acetamido-2,6-beta-L-arabino-hexul-4-ose reductase